MNRILVWFVPVRPTPGPGCLWILFVSGIALLTLWSALTPGSPA